MNIKKIITIMFIFFGIFSSVFAYHHHVRSPKFINSSVLNDKIKYNESTIYSTYWSYAVSKWNNQGDVDITEVNGYWNSYLDVDDVYDTSIQAAAYFQRWYYFPDEIRFNYPYASLANPSELKQAAMHELGHALALDHHNHTGNVMYHTATGITNLGWQDKYDYNYLWD